MAINYTMVHLALLVAAILLLLFSIVLAIAWNIPRLLEDLSGRTDRNRVDMLRKLYEKQGFSSASDLSVGYFPPTNSISTIELSTTGNLRFTEDKESCFEIPAVEKETPLVPKS